MLKLQITPKVVELDEQAERGSFLRGILRLLESAQRFPQTSTAIFANIYSGLRERIQRFSQTYMAIFANVYSGLRKGIQRFSRCWPPIDLKS